MGCPNAAVHYTKCSALPYYYYYYRMQPGAVQRRSWHTHTLLFFFILKKKKGKECIRFYTLVTFSLFLLFFFLNISFHLADFVD